LPPPENIAVTIGIKIANVPQLEPVEKAKNIAIINITIGIITPFVTLPPKVFSTKADICKASPTPFNDQANTKINIDGIINLKPSAKLSINFGKVIILRGIYKININIKVTVLAKTKLTSASQLAKAEITFLAPPKNPV